MDRNKRMEESGADGQSAPPTGLARRRLLLAGTAAVALAGCGGGGDGGADPSAPGDSGGQGGGDQGAFSAQERIAATARIAEKFEELTAGGPSTAAAWNALRDWLLTQPEYTSAGVEDRLVWARFRDGRYFIYSDNWRQLDPGLLWRTSSRAQAMSARNPPDAALAAGVQVPGSDRAAILSFTGPEFAQEGTASMARMNAALKARDWRVATDRALTVEALKNLGELGFLFMTSHSGLLGPQGEKQFAVMTDTVVTVRNEIDYFDELWSGRLIYHRDRTNWQRLGHGSAPRYAITAEFVRKYMKFSANSLVIMLSCNSGADYAEGFHAALAGQGCGTLIGWNGNSNGHAFKTIDLLMDRLTGVNDHSAPNPPGRAFNMDDVWAYLARTGMLVTEGSEGDPPSYVRRFGNGFNISNPLITELQVKAEDRLVIHGDFGSERGTVSIGGTPVAVDSWQSGAIELVLPTGSNDPPGSLGDVVVKARARTSNPRTLTSWRGLVSYTLDDLDEGGTLSHTIKVRLHLRGDAFARRTEVDGTLLPNTWNVMPASDTVITYEAGGTRDHGDDDLEVWSGNGSYELVSGVFNANEPKMSLVARIDAINQRLELTALPPTVAPGIVRQRPQGLPLFPSGLMIMPPFKMQFMNENGNLNDHAPLIYGNYLPFGATGTVGAGQHVASEGSLRRTVQWAAMTALPALDDRIGR